MKHMQYLHVLGLFRRGRACEAMKTVSLSLPLVFYTLNSA